MWIVYVSSRTAMTSQDILQEFHKFSEKLSQAAKRKKSPCLEETELKKERLMEEEEEEEKRFSSDMADCCAHQCRMCDRLVSLTSLRCHTRASHHITIKEYAQQFGNYREQLHIVTWHSCGFCQKEILLDGDEIHKHCKSHGVTMAEYSNLFLGSKSKKASAPKPQGSPLPGKREVLEEKVTGLFNTIEAIENILDFLWKYLYNQYWSNLRFWKIKNPPHFHPGQLFLVAKLYCSDVYTHVTYLVFFTTCQSPEQSQHSHNLKVKIF